MNAESTLRTRLKSSPLLWLQEAAELEEMLRAQMAEREEEAGGARTEAAVLETEVDRLEVRHTLIDIYININIALPGSHGAPFTRALRLS